MNPTFNDVSAQGGVPSTKNNRGSGRKKLIIGLSAAGLVVVAIVVLLFTGFIYIGFKSPEQKVVVRQTACDSLVEEWVKLRDEMGNELSQRAVFTGLAERVPDSDIAGNDANCQFINMMNTLLTGDPAQALEHARSIRSLLDKNLPLDARLPILDGGADGAIDFIQRRIEFLNNEERIESAY